jgi:hypothetical protein
MLLRTTDTRRLNFKFFAAEIQIPLPNKIGADSPAENIPYALKKFQPKMSAQAQKSEIFKKKSSLWVSVVRICYNCCRT